MKLTGRLDASATHQVRAEVFHEIDFPGNPTVAAHVPPPKPSKETCILNELIRGYLQFNGYQHTLAVFVAEAALTTEPVFDRDFLRKDLGIMERTSELPLLYPLLMGYRKAKEMQQQLAPIVARQQAMAQPKPPSMFVSTQPGPMLEEKSQHDMSRTPLTMMSTAGSDTAEGFSTSRQGQISMSPASGPPSVHFGDSGSYTYMPTAGHMQQGHARTAQGSAPAPLGPREGYVSGSGHLQADSVVFDVPAQFRGGQNVSLLPSPGQVLSHTIPHGLVAGQQFSVPVTSLVGTSGTAVAPGSTSLTPQTVAGGTGAGARAGPVRHEVDSPNDKWDSLFHDLDKNDDGMLGQAEIINRLNEARKLGNLTFLSRIHSVLGMPTEVHEGTTRDEFEKIFHDMDQDDSKKISLAGKTTPPPRSVSASLFPRFAQI